MGTKINQAVMAKQLNASRTPVAYALHRLNSEGLVDSIPNAGFYVHRVSVKELADLFSFREALDVAMVTDLVDSLSEEQIDQLEALFESFQQADAVDTPAYLDADITFHTSLIEWCDNELVKRANDNLQILNRSFISGLVREPSETLPEHMSVIAGLRARDIEATREAMRVHARKTASVLLDTVVNLRKLGVDPHKITVDEIDLRDTAKSMARRSLER